DYDGRHAALGPHGRVEELEVAGRRVGARLYPRDAELRALAPAGIEFAPPRTERSTGPGRHDFEIVADPSLSIEDDMARRDFTVNAMARRLETGDLVDPFGGADDLRRGVLRTVGPRSFAEDPLRLVRGLRLVAQLGLEPDEATLEQMRKEADSIRLVSGERVGGGLRADGLGEPRARGDHAQRGAALASEAMGRLRYPTRLRSYVTRLVRAHAFPLEGIDELAARRFLRAHGDDLAFDLVSLKEADLRGKQVP